MSAAILGMLCDRLDQRRILDQILPLNVFSGKNFDCSVLSSSNLSHVDGMGYIALFFQHCYSRIELGGADTDIGCRITTQRQRSLNTSTNVEGALLVNLSLEHTRGRLQDVLVFLLIIGRQGTNRRFVDAHALADSDVGQALLFQTNDLIDLLLALLVDRNR